VATTGVEAQRPATERYSITDLGTLGGAASEASGVNLVGEVVGMSTTAGGLSHAFLYRNGRMSDLGTLTGGTTSYGTAIADNGAVVGYSGINAFGPQFQEFIQGFVWQDGTMRALGAIYCPCSFNSRYGTSRAFAVNNAGRIVGDSVTSLRGRYTHAFLMQGNTMRDLGADIDWFSDSVAYGINDVDEVVGALNGHAVLVRGGESQDLGVLPGHAASDARAVNTKGQVAGNSVTAGGISHAFLWDLGAMRNLGTLRGDVASEARAINVDSDVVGRSGVADLSTAHAVLWRDGVAVDLNGLITAPGWILLNATGINNVGQIAGIGMRNGYLRAFLLTPQ
jgi:probable HAF family extracellular repeat protein